MYRAVYRTTGIVFRYATGDTYWTERAKVVVLVTPYRWRRCEMWGTASVGFADAIWGAHQTMLVHMYGWMMKGYEQL